MVSQSQEEWEGGSGSMLSLDGRPRPTPPSYYDAVRSRHSLSQPAATNSPQEQSPDKQLKYNSLPRPLPQRYPPANGRWPEEYYAPRGDAPVRQQYDSPPKPANRVPLQLLPPKRPSFPGDPRVPDPRGNGTLPNRKDGLQSLSLRPDPRQPPTGNTRRPPQQRPPGPNDTNSLPRRDSNGLLRRCYPILPNGSSPSLAYPPSPAAPLPSPYEPRYSKSGKLHPRSAPTQEPRPMPPPVVMLRTGPLGTYPDAETLKMYQPSPPAPQETMERQRTGDMSQQIYVDTNSYNNGQQQVVADHLAIPYRIPQVLPKEGEFKSRTLPAMSGRSDPRRPEAGYYDGRSSRRSTGGSTTNLDKDGDAIYANQQFYGQMPMGGNGPKAYNDQQRGKSPQSNGVQKAYNGGDYPDQQRGHIGHPKTHNDYPEQQRGQLHNGHQKMHNDYPNQQRGQLSNGHQKVLSDYPDQQRGQLHNGHQKMHNDYPDQQRGQLSNGHQKMHGDYPEQQQRSQHLNNGHPKLHNGYVDQHRGQPNGQPKMHNGGNSNDYPDQRGPQLNNGHPKSYKGQPPSPSPPKAYNNGQPPEGPLYENSQQLSSENVYANHHVYNSTTPKTTRSDRRNTHPPPVAQKPPQPTDMVMVTETHRDWSVSQSFPKDQVVKPTPRMPRLPNGILSTSSGQSVPAYQFVLNELSSHPLHHVSPQTTASSSTLSLRSGYDSSSSSSREFGRRPSKSDSSADLARSSGNSLKPNGSHQQIDKSLLSVSMTSLCSDVSSLISLRPRKHRDETWDRMSEETQKRKEKGSKFSASPWDREEKEKLQQEQVLDARRVRDQEIAHLEQLEERSEKQSEWLRILRLEREFQRRAEDACTSSSSSDTDDTDDTDKVESFHRDKLTVIPNERMGLQLLDELLDTPSKTSPPAKNPSPPTPEKHFLPLDVTIPEQPPTHNHHLPVTNNILKISSEDRKPPVPAPRPSKRGEDNVSSLAKLDISDPCAYFCSGEDGGGDDHPPSRDWTIEVPNNFPLDDEDSSRIYENVIKPVDYHCTNGSHTLPKVSPATAIATSGSSASRRQPKFPVMGVSSTLTKKANGGYVPSDVDVLPSLYASCKASGGTVVSPVPTDLVDKSPEFKKMWVQRPEKLTFQDKIRKFSLQAGEEDPPRDRVKNSRAQREIEIKFSDAQKRAAAAAAEV